MRISTRAGVRRLAVALATAQLVAYAVAPILEARVERAPGPTSVEQSHSTGCVRLHQAATCLACQLVVIRARAGQAAQVPQLLAATQPPAADSRAAAGARAPPRQPHTRAPPPLSA